MITPTESQKRIESLKAEIARLEAQALNELREKRDSLLNQLREINEQIVEMTGMAELVDMPPRTRSPKEEAKSLSLQELKALLEKAPEKTLNIRKEKLDLRNIKVLAEANPHLLKIGGKSPWPTVTLLK